MVSFELGKEKKKDVFVLSQAWDMSLSHASDKTKNIFSKNFLCQARNEGTQTSDGGEVLPPETSSSESAAK